MRALAGLAQLPATVTGACLCATDGVPLGAAPEIDGPRATDVAHGGTGWARITRLSEESHACEANGEESSPCGSEPGDGEVNRHAPGATPGR